MTRVLVTGATGFLGSRVARLLAARGDGVRVLARPTSDRRRLRGVACEVAVGDVTDATSVDRATRGVDVVVHCAALYELGTRDPARMRRINVDGTDHVLRAAADAGAIAVHVSSVAALGPTGIEPRGEEHWSDDAPRSAYQATKREAHTRALAARGRVRVAIPGTIYGPDDPSPVGLLHALAARRLLRVGFRREVRMSLVHVDDCAQGILRLVDSGQDGREYVLSAQAVSFGEWMAALARASGTRPPAVWLDDKVLRAAGRAARFAPAFVREALAMSDGVHWSFSGDRARRELGWSPRSLEEGLRETVEWVRGGSDGRLFVPRDHGGGAPARG